MVTKVSSVDIILERSIKRVLFVVVCLLPRLVNHLLGAIDIFASTICELVTIGHLIDLLCVFLIIRIELLQQTLLLLLFNQSRAYEASKSRCLFNQALSPLNILATIFKVPLVG